MSLMASNTPPDPTEFPPDLRDEVETLRVTMDCGTNHASMLDILEERFGLDASGRETVSCMMEENTEPIEQFQGLCASTTGLQNSLEELSTKLPSVEELQSLRETLGLSSDARDDEIDEATLTIIEGCVRDNPMLLSKVGQRLELASLPSQQAFKQAQDACDQAHDALRYYQTESKQRASQVGEVRHKLFQMLSNSYSNLRNKFKMEADAAKQDVRQVKGDLRHAQKDVDSAKKALSHHTDKQNLVQEATEVRNASLLEELANLRLKNRELEKQVEEQAKEIIDLMNSRDSYSSANEQSHDACTAIERKRRKEIVRNRYLRRRLREARISIQRRDMIVEDLNFGIELKNDYLFALSQNTETLEIQLQKNTALLNDVQEELSLTKSKAENLKSELEEMDAGLRAAVRCLGEAADVPVLLPGNIKELAQEVQAKIWRRDETISRLQGDLVETKASKVASQQVILQVKGKLSAQETEATMLKGELHKVKRSLHSAEVKCACIPAYREITGYLSAQLDCNPLDFEALERTLQVIHTFEAIMAIDISEKPNLTIMSEIIPAQESAPAGTQSMRLLCDAHRIPMRLTGECLQSLACSLMERADEKLLAKCLPLVYGALHRFCHLTDLDHTVPHDFLLLQGFEMICTFLKAGSAMEQVRTLFSSIEKRFCRNSSLIKVFIDVVDGLLQGRTLSLTEELMSFAWQRNLEVRVGSFSFHSDLESLILIAEGQAGDQAGNRLAVIGRGFWVIEVSCHRGYRLVLNDAPILGCWKSPWWVEDFFWLNLSEKFASAIIRRAANEQ